MHTSAHATPLVVAQYTGTLLHRAEVRTAVLDGDGHSVPVLCMDVELDNGLHTYMHAEEPYPVGHYAQAEAKARTLKKGDQVSVSAPLVGVRLTMPNATVTRLEPLADTTHQPHPQPQMELV